ncbi:hypothetical protein V7S43_013577 [Phytophthora oleae]|uniref:Uncharacterized protein n=1 Tax=Phytophthora oleae TaxID=2107226 RepID=A0ABD3F798_9STRA
MKRGPEWLKLVSTAHTSQISATSRQLRDGAAVQVFILLPAAISLLLTVEKAQDCKPRPQVHFQSSRLARRNYSSSVHGKLRILEELRYLRDLFAKNARRLLHLVATSATKARADITKLLQKYYSLLFTNVPARVHQAMFDFNQWLAEVLDDTRSEGIEWGPSYGENPWLALEEQPQDGPLNEAFTVDHASTIELLRSACEYYIVQSESLQQSNVVLSMQVEELKIQLTDALVRAFDSQQALEREREVSALQARRFVMGVQIGDHLSQESTHGYRPADLHQQITDAFRMLNEVRAPHEDTETTASEATSVSDFEGIAVEGDQAEGDIEPESVEEVLEDQKHLPSDTVPTEGQKSPQSAVAQCDERDYQHLTQLQSSEELGGSWYQHALRSLKEKREQRRLERRDQPKPDLSETSFVTSSTEAVCEDSSFIDQEEYVKLAATRDAAENGEDVTWYRRALQHLKKERQRRVSFHDRNSFSSTISIAD